MLDMLVGMDARGPWRPRHDTERMHALEFEWRSISDSQMVGADAIRSEDTLCNKKIYPGYQFPAKNSPRWTARLRTSDATMQLMVRRCHSVHNSMSAIMRRKLDAAAIESMAERACAVIALAKATDWVAWLLSQHDHRLFSSDCDSLAKWYHQTVTPCYPCRPGGDARGARQCRDARLGR